MSGESDEKAAKCLLLGLAKTGRFALGTNLRINADRLWDSLMEMAKIGATEKGGVCRLALTDLDKQARDLFCAWAKEAGCTIRVDKMGNIFARRPGKDNSLSPVDRKSVV